MRTKTIYFFSLFLTITMMTGCFHISSGPKPSKSKMTKKYSVTPFNKIENKAPAKRAFDEFGEKKLPTVKTLQAEYSDLLAKKKAAYEDYKRLRKENQELQTVKANVDALLRIEQVQEYQREKENNQEQGR